MKAFIKAIDDKAQMTILTDWDYPTKEDDKEVTIPKPELESTTDEDRLAFNNSKAINVIFDTMDQYQFKLLSVYDTAKDAWEILHTAHKGADFQLGSQSSRFVQRGLRTSRCMK